MELWIHNTTTSLSSNRIRGHIDIGLSMKAKSVIGSKLLISVVVSVSDMKIVVGTTGVLEGPSGLK